MKAKSILSIILFISTSFFVLNCNSSKKSDESSEKTSVLIKAETGGTVNLGDTVKLTIPENSLESDTEISIEKISDFPQKDADGLSNFGLAYKLLPKSTVFDLSKPAVLEMAYDENAVTSKGFSPNTMIMYYYDEEEDMYVAVRSFVDTQKKIITAYIEHFTIYLPQAKALLATNTPPTVALQNSIPNPPRADAPVYVRATVRDYDGSIAGVRVYYQKLKPTTGPLLSGIMKRENVVNSFNTYTYSIPASICSRTDIGAGNEFRYYVVATDNLGAITQSITRNVNVANYYTANSLTITPTSLSICVGFSRSFLIRGIDNGGTTITIFPESAGVTNDLGSIENYSTNGILFKAKKSGTGVLTAGFGTQSASANLTIYQGEAVKLAILGENSLPITGEVNILSGQQYHFDVLAYDEFDNTILANPLWSADPFIGTIDQDGILSTAGAYGDGYVRAELGILYAEQPVHVYRNFANDITAFAINGFNGTISGTAINVVLPWGTDLSSLVADFTTTGQIVQVNGINQTSGVTSNDFTNPVVYTVIAEDTTTKAYTVTVTAPMPFLTGLSLSDGNLSPAFNEGIFSYNCEVSYQVVGIRVIPTAGRTTSVITVNGNVVISGQESDEIPLFTGLNNITVEVTAEDSTVRTYTIAVTRLVEPSHNANLSSLVVSAGTLSPAFTENTTAYNLEIPYQTSSIYVTPTSAGFNSIIRVNGTEVASGASSGSISLSEGLNTINIAVTAEDGTTIKTYIISAFRTSSSSNTNLAWISLSSGTLSPVFSENTTGYNCEVNYADSFVTVTPVASGINSTITVNGNYVVSGTASNPVSLNSGLNTITIEVTAENGTTKTYIISVDRVAASNNANLAGLSLSYGNLSPAFAENTTAYNAEIAYTVTSITVTPVTASRRSSVTVDGIPVASGTASQLIELDPGANTIPVQVTAEDGTVKTYIIVATLLTEPSHNPNLANITLSGGTLSPVFTENTTLYNCEVPYRISSLTVTPVSAGVNSTCKVNDVAVASGTASGPIALNVGLNVITVLGIAEDKTATKTYTLLVTRVEASTNADLAGLSLSAGTISPVFNPATMSYTAEVPYQRNSVTVTPIAAFAYATITVNGTPVASGTASAPIGLSVGQTGINVTITAEDGTTTKTYTVTVTRIAASTNANLAGLSVSVGSLAPAFAQDTTSYNVNLWDSTASFTVTPTAAGINAIITVNGTVVTSGTASQPIDIFEGDNIITLNVTAEAGNNKVYIIDVKRTDLDNWVEKEVLGNNMSWNDWSSIASSTDGTRLAAVVGDGYIYTSTDRGATWTERRNAGSKYWRSITSSSDGTQLAAAAYNGYIYTSTDGGTTWTERTAAGSRSWVSITSSSDGTRLAAVAYNGYIYTSVDGGATWTECTNAGSKYWRSITSSSDGTQLAAAAYNGYIYTSTDGGTTWTERTGAGSRSWLSITSSSDGTRLAAGVVNGYIYTSIDGGATWTERTGAGSRYWLSITSSSDGTRLAATAYNGYIYTSTDGGATWTERTAAGSRQWYPITSSSDGTRLAASVGNGYIYTSTDGGATWTERTAAGSRQWYSITCSSDFSRLAAVAQYEKNIFVCE